MNEEQLDKALAPYITEILKTLRAGQIDIAKLPAPQVTVTVPEIKVPKIVVPEITVPEIKLPPFPAIRIPAPQVTVNVDEVSVKNWPTTLEKEILAELKKIEQKRWSNYGSGVTQYQSGETLATITGTAALWEDTGGVVRTPSAAHPFPVAVISGGGGTGGLTDTELRAIPVAVSGTVTANAGTNLNTSLLALEAGGNLAAIKADVDKIPSQGQALAAGSMPVVLTALQLSALTPPAAITGFATSAKQDTAQTSLSSIDGKITAVNTGAVVVSSSALPSGAATSALQLADNHNVKLNSVTKSTSTGAGVTSTAASATRQPLDVVIYTASGAAVDPTPITGFATSAKQDTGNTSLSSIDTKTPALGQALAASSVPVVLTALQVTALTPPAAITGFALAATQTDKSQFTKITDGTDTLLVSAAGSAQVSLDAETTKVIGVTRSADGAGNLLTSNSTTYTAKFGLDGNLLGTLGTAFSTAGKVDVKGADGDVFVRQATAGNLNATVVGTGTFATQSAITAALNSLADGSLVTLGAKTDAKSTATDATSVTAMQVLKQISASVQAPPSQAVTFTGSTDVATQTTLALIKAKTDNLDAALSTLTSTLPAAAIVQGENADIDTASEQVTTVSSVAKHGVRVIADVANTGILYIGGSTVTADTSDSTDGFPLYPGDSLFLPVNNANLVYAIASVNNQKLRWIAV